MKKKLKKPAISKTSNHSGQRKTGANKPDKIRTRRPKGLKTLELFEHDIPQSLYEELWPEKILQIDTETTGLDFRNDKLMLVQLVTRDGRAYLVRRPDVKSDYTKQLLLLGARTYYFHFAMFDLRFLKQGLKLGSLVNREIHCTKTAMKIVYPDKPCGLGASLREILNIKLAKAETLSDWNAKKLTKGQQYYAVADALYLERLHETILAEANHSEYFIYNRAMRVIPTLVDLEVEGYTDLFQHKKEKKDKIRELRNWWLSHLQGEENE